MCSSWLIDADLQCLLRVMSHVAFLKVYVSNKMVDFNVVSHCDIPRVTIEDVMSKVDIVLPLILSHILTLE